MRLEQFVQALNSRPADAWPDTTMIFDEGCDLPHFAAFVLLDRPRGIGGATSFVLEAVTWRANMGWAGALGLDDGSPEEFGALYAGLALLLPKLRLIGGCCGSDHRHVGAACAHLHR